mgnify:CR=1 FL=1
MSHKSVSGTDINSNNHTCGFCDNVLNEDIGSECDFCDADLCDSCMETCLSRNIAQYCKDCSRTCEVEVFQHTACKDCFHEPDPPPLCCADTQPKPTKATKTTATNIRICDMATSLLLAYRARSVARSGQRFNGDAAFVSRQYATCHSLVRHTSPLGHTTVRGYKQNQTRRV